MGENINLADVTDKDVLVGIVTFNRFQKLTQTIAECRSREFRRIVVVDNGSTDGTREYLREQKDIVGIFAAQNEGGSGGFSRLMDHFYTKTTCEFLLLMDDDAYPSFSRTQLASTLTTHSSQSFMAYACKVVYPDGALCEMNRPGRNVLDHHPLSQWARDFHLDDSSPETTVDFAGFVGLVLTRDAIRCTGIVSKQFFIYSDDTYYTLSLSRLGGKILYCPRLIFIHDCKRSSRNLINHDPVRIERDVVNKIVMIREYSSHVKLYIFLYLVRLLWKNLSVSSNILRAARKGIRANLSSFRNQRV